jgi:hypothetical protein
MIPSRDAFTTREWRLVRRLDTPRKVQHWLNALAYNTEKRGGTLRSFREVVRRQRAHCMEAALFAAVVLEQHGYPPIVMSLESKDWLDQVIFIYQRNGRWGSIARSRDPGLHGRKAVFRSPRTLALSYVDGYVDYTGRLLGYGVCNLDEALPTYDWRFSRKNVWKVENLLIGWPHKKFKTSTRRYRALLEYYKEYRATHNDEKPWRHLRGREKWTPLPPEFTGRSGRSGRR